MKSYVPEVPDIDIRRKKYMEENQKFKIALGLIPKSSKYLIRRNFRAYEFSRIFAQKLQMRENLYKNFAQKVGARK